MAESKTTFLKGREGKNGLAGYLANHIYAYGTATVLNGQTTIAVTDTGILATDMIIGTLRTSTNAVYLTSVAITAATSFTFTVSGDPGVSGGVINYIIIRA